MDFPIKIFDEILELNQKQIISGYRRPFVRRVCGFFIGIRSCCLMGLRPSKQAFCLAKGRVKIFRHKEKVSRKKPTTTNAVQVTLSGPQFSLEKGLSEVSRPLLGRVWTSHRKGDYHGVLSLILIGSSSGLSPRRLILPGLSLNFNYEAKKMDFTEILNSFFWLNWKWSFGTIIE
mmetsp:Transcript_9648/g.12606  ORF Transcript_9648/g.12606 Transcript_9648/m.12606 type:complete len:175 (+) Transcript_9648:970-1494(+)